MRILKILAPALLVVLSLPAGAPAAAAQAQHCTGHPGKVRLYVNIEGVRQARGEIAASLYGDNRGKFLAKRGALYVGRVAATAPRTRMCIYLPSTGVWALAVYHDADGDRTFDRTSVGLPAEAYGFTNNPSTVFGLPAFSKVRLRVAKSGLSTNVRLTYP